MRGLSIYIYNFFLPYIFPEIIHVFLLFLFKQLLNIRQFGRGWPGGNDEHGENGHSGYLGYITIKNH